MWRRIAQFESVNHLMIVTYNDTAKLKEYRDVDIHTVVEGEAQVGESDSSRDHQFCGLSGDNLRLQLIATTCIIATNTPIPIDHDPASPHTHVQTISKSRRTPFKNEISRVGLLVITYQT